MADRDVLAARQREVLDDLLAGRVPVGFDLVGSALTTTVLHRKRSSAALSACPELAALPGWRDRFHAWAAEHPQSGCVHDDVRRFAAALTGDEPGWVRLHEVYDGRRRFARAVIAGESLLAVRIKERVFIVGDPRRKDGSPCPSQC